MKEPPSDFLCFIRLSVTKHQASEWTILSGPLSAKIQFKTSRFRAWKQSKQNSFFTLNIKILTRCVSLSPAMENAVPCPNKTKNVNRARPPNSRAIFTDSSLACCGSSLNMLKTGTQEMLFLAKSKF